MSSVSNARRTSLESAANSSDTRGSPLSISSRYALTTSGISQLIVSTASAAQGILAEAERGKDREHLT